MCYSDPQARLRFLAMAWRLETNFSINTENLHLEGKRLAYQRNRAHKILCGSFADGNERHFGALFPKSVQQRPQASLLQPVFRTVDLSGATPRQEARGSTASSAAAGADGTAAGSEEARNQAAAASKQAASEEAGSA